MFLFSLTALRGKRALLLPVLLVHWLAACFARGDTLQLDLSLAHSNEFAQPTDIAETKASVSSPIPTKGDRAILLPLTARKSYPLNIIRFKVDRSLRVRGWEIGDDVFFGQAKVANQWGVGIVVSNGSFSYGINNRGVGILKRF